MADLGIMLRDLEGFGGGPRKPWIVIVIVVVLCTLGLISLLRYLDKQAERRRDPEAEVAKPVTARRGGKRRGQRAERAATPAVASSRLSAELAEKLTAARSLSNRGEPYTARTNLLTLLKSAQGEAEVEAVERLLGEVNIELVTKPHWMPGKIDYAIESGDSLKILARRYGTTIDLIVKANSVPNPDRIHIGDRLRILDKPKFEILVSKEKNDLLLTLNGEFFKRYTVGTGSYGRTPVGTFKIQDKIENPPWWRPDGGVIPFGDPENILGTRWLSITATGDTPPARGYGLHGTWDNSTLGQQSSAGCVRMKNSEVEELYLIIPEGTPVTIVD